MEKDSLRFLAIAVRVRTAGVSRESPLPCLPALQRQSYGSFTTTTAALAAPHTSSPPVHSLSRQSSPQSSATRSLCSSAIPFFTSTIRLIKRHCFRRRCIASHGQRAAGQAPWSTLLVALCAWIQHTRHGSSGHPPLCHATSSPLKLSAMSQTNPRLGSNHRMMRTTMASPSRLPVNPNQRKDDFPTDLWNGLRRGC